MTWGGIRRWSMGVVVALVLRGHAAAGTLFVNQAGESAGANTATCPQADPCSLSNAIAQAGSVAFPGRDTIVGPTTINRRGTAGLGISDVLLTPGAARPPH